MPDPKTEIVARPSDALARRQELLEAAVGYAGQSRAPRTVEAYKRHWRAFEAWCREQGAEALPAAPAAVALYLTHRAEQGRKVATLQLDLAAINAKHRDKRKELPSTSVEVRETFRGIRRAIGTAQRRAAPAVASDVQEMIECQPDTMIGLRNAALITLGFAGAFRRSELVAIDVEHIAFSREGITVTIPRSKTDQEGQGAKVGIAEGRHPATCPVRLLRRYLEASGIREDAVFRGFKSGDEPGERITSGYVAKIVKRAAELAGLDPSKYSGHSLRAGLATSAARAGKDDRSIMRQGRWKSRTMLDRYVREETLFRDNASEGLL